MSRVVRTVRGDIEPGELGPELSRRIFIENPAEAFAFEPRDLVTT